MNIGHALLQHFLSSSTKIRVVREMQVMKPYVGSIKEIMVR